MNKTDIVDSRTQVDAVVAIFGTQVALASAIGLNPRNISEWKRQDLGVPARHYRAIYRAAASLGKADDLPCWFPRFNQDAAA